MVEFRNILVASLAFNPVGAITNKRVGLILYEGIVYA